MARSDEDYLRTIYTLHEDLKSEKNGVRGVDIANSLGIAKSSVSAMVKKLTKKDYLKSKPYSNIYLTNKGYSKAKKLTHNYRIIEVFLTEMLNYNKKNVHNEAHRLEHAFSQKTIGMLDKLLNNPSICPHGKRIH